MSGEEDVEAWVILHISEDDSFILIRECNVVCAGDSPSIGDEVNCYYSGHQYTGEVVDKGDDHAHLTQRLNQLNKNRKRKLNDSFHEDRPRKAAQKCKSWLTTQAVGAKKKVQEPAADSKTKSDPKSKSMNKTSGSSGEKSFEVLASVKKTCDSKSNATSSVKIKQEKKNDDDSDFTNFDILDGGKISSDEENDLSLDDFKAFKEVAKKYCKKDFESLLKMAASEKQKSKLSATSKGRENDSGSVYEKSSPPVKRKSLKTDGENIARTSKQSHALKESKRLCESSSTSSSDGEEGAITKEERKMGNSSKDFGSKGGRKRDSSSSSSCSNSDDESYIKAEGKASVSNKLKFNGKMFQHSAQDAKVEELVGNTGVYISTKDLRAVKGSAISATALARQLVRKIFTSEALLACSVGGNKSCGKGKEKVEVRPPLDAEGISAIIDFAKKRSLKKHWKEVSEANLRTAIGSMLCENRLKEKMNNEAELRLKKQSEEVAKDSKKQSGESKKEEDSEQEDEDKKAEKADAYKSASKQSLERMKKKHDSSSE